MPERNGEGQGLGWGCRIRGGKVGNGEAKTGRWVSWKHSLGRPGTQRIMVGREPKRQVGRDAEAWRGLESRRGLEGVGARTKPD